MDEFYPIGLSESISHEVTVRQTGAISTLGGSRLQVVTSCAMDGEVKGEIGVVILACI